LPKLKDVLPPTDDNTIGEIADSVVDIPQETEGE
jgi:hypothetical protein